MDWVLLLAICNFLLIFANFWWTFTVIRGSSNAIAQLLQDLDQNLAAVVEKFISESPMGDVNPIQATIMQLIQSKMNAPATEIKEIPKDETGKFTKSPTDISLNTE